MKVCATGSQGLVVLQELELVVEKFETSVLVFVWVNVFLAPEGEAPKSNACEVEANPCE